ncbi:MAG TPA: NAD(P)-dependent oxidoreductase [Casimicrobiaceae bacterium]|nr:NAD(P)-dependent oxidoreductase [Casimicrobiaceae bacterium]
MSGRRLAFLGLGVMGFPMAGHLARTGHAVTVYNRTPAKAARWVEKHGGKSTATPAAAVAEAEIVLMCVGNDDDVRAVALGEGGALAAMKAGATLVDHTTASASVARELYAAAKSRGVRFLDAPVSGGQAGAANGKLTIMVGGDADVFAAAEPVLASYARAVTLMGPAGAGQLTKMVNQISVASVIQGLAEGINFAGRAGLDVERVLDVISKGAAQSWQMENRGKTMAADQFDFGFAVDWMRKDLAICLSEARRNGAALPMTAVIDQFYSRIQARGGGRWDTSSLIRLLRDAK